MAFCCFCGVGYRLGFVGCGRKFERDLVGICWHKVHGLGVVGFKQREPIVDFACSGQLLQTPRAAAHEIVAGHAVPIPDVYFEPLFGDLLRSNAGNGQRLVPFRVQALLDCLCFLHFLCVAREVYLDKRVGEPVGVFCSQSFGFVNLDGQHAGFDLNPKADMTEEHPFLLGKDPADRGFLFGRGLCSRFCNLGLHGSFCSRFRNLGFHGSFVCLFFGCFLGCRCS